MSVIMKKHIIEATIEALKSIRNPRYFNNERGYQGEFYCALRKQLAERAVIGLDKHDTIIGDIILDMEYQKRGVHRTQQRPDIILHKPAKVTNTSVDENNFAVWALKRKCRCPKAKKDFTKLNEMFRNLNYPLGFFINIDNDSHHLEHYKGDYDKRIFGFSVRLRNGVLYIKQGAFMRGKLIEKVVPA